MGSRGRRRVALWGGLLAGLGLGACLAISLHVFETANSAAQSLYPSMGSTVFWVLFFSGSSGLGLGLVACALIRSENVQQAGEPSSQTGPKPERRILGLRIDS
ncbi:hypothetical protein EAS64_40460 [Trebonia kvetii]|uniref:Uncharacterized protein n=1 Tax=Trebonia kvetii TaxID=2480626 RepID=A0A6P2BN13_9ACTN|nr:hypothetical protein [Trebonia kvetii]TVY99910.1 hypothetical protein EAS64_40460 [Trebonia kvetii]